MRKKPQWANIFADGFFTIGFIFYVYFLYTKIPILDLSFNPVSELIWIPILGFVSYFNFLRDNEESRDTWLYFLFFFFVESVGLSATKNARLDKFFNSVCFGHANQVGDGLSFLLSAGFLFYLGKHLVRKRL